MNKEKIVEELNTWVKQELGLEYHVEMTESNLALYFHDDFIVGIVDFNPEKLTLGLGEVDLVLTLTENGVMTRFYRKARRLINKSEPKKYTIQIAQDGRNYLHANCLTNYKEVCFDKPIISSLIWVREFTKEQIKEFKKRDDLAIDWDKAIIKEVK